jgi:hypothetical protein
MASNRRVDGSRLSIGASCHIHMVGSRALPGVGDRSLRESHAPSCSLYAFGTRAAVLESLMGSCPGPETLVATA